MRDTRNAVREIAVDQFAGVDFSTDETKVSWSRSPDACNMIADEMYYPVKRTGYRKQANFMTTPVYGLHTLNEDVLCHAGNTLWRLADTGTNQALYTHMNAARSRSFVMGGKLWILDGRNYLVYDGTSATCVRDCAYIPTTTINATPKNGGTSFEAVNLLTPMRINTFVGDGTTKIYHLDAQDIVESSVVCAKYHIDSVDTVRGKVTFSEPPPDGAGLANVIVQFAVRQTEEQTIIDRCRICGMYGGMNDTRVFVSGNPDQPNVDWQSGLYDPTYFPDTGYTSIGSDASAVVGYVRQYDTQIVLKEDGQDAKQYLRSFELDADGKPRYPLRQGSEAVGAAGMDTHDVLDGVPVYLSTEGVKAVYGTYSSAYRNVSGISPRIDARLLREAHLENACACVWRKKWYLAVNGHCYVADARQMADGIPEWYYWDNIPVSCFLPREDSLWFGTPDGRVCQFCDGQDKDAYQDDRQAIAARWVTPLSDLGDAAHGKNILGVQAALRPFSSTGVDVTYRTDRASYPAGSWTVDTATHADAHIALKKRVRNTGVFQVILQNSGNNQGFGLLGFTIRCQSRGTR